MCKCSGITRHIIEMAYRLRWRFGELGLEINWIGAARSFVTCGAEKVIIREKMCNCYVALIRLICHCEDCICTWNGFPCEVPTSITIYIVFFFSRDDAFHRNCGKSSLITTLIHVCLCGFTSNSPLPSHPACILTRMNRKCFCITT